jgi:hypothetical protein
MTDVEHTPNATSPSSTGREGSVRLLPNLGLALTRVLAFTQLLSTACRRERLWTIHCQGHGLVLQAVLRIDRIAYAYPRVQAPAFSRRMRSSLRTFSKLG